MSHQYEYLETSLNYAENEEYENFNNTVQEEQTFDADMEVTEQQDIENETSKLRHQDADFLIQAEIKDMIVIKEKEKTTLKVLSEHKNNIMEKIKDLQDLRDTIGEENEALNINTEIERDELLNLQKRVVYNGEIVGRLEEFMKTIENGFKQLKFRNHQYSVNLINHKKKILDAQNSSRISQLKAEINNKKMCRKDDPNVNPNKNENLILKAKIIEKQEYLKYLYKRNQQTESKKENIKKLMNEKDNIEEVLKNKKLYLQELNSIKNQKEADINACIKQLDVKKEERNKSLNDGQQILENLKKEITETIEVKDSLCVDILLKEEYNSQLDEKISKITSNIKDQKEALDIYMEKCKHDINIAQEKLNSVRNDLTQMNNEDGQLNCCLQLARQEYIAKMEEKSNNLKLKLELEKKLSSDEIFLTNIKLLEEQITLKKKTPEELLEKIDKLSTDDALQDLKKKKAYLISSTDYLNEKLENVKTESEYIKTVLGDLEAVIDSNAQSNKEKQKEYDTLLQQLKDQKEDANAEYQPNPTPTSILKSPLFHKKIPISPKKVQFEGVSSYESSVSSEAVNLSGSTQQTIAGKTFDDILEEIQAESFKTPIKTPKKRRLRFE